MTWLPLKLTAALLLGLVTAHETTIRCTTPDGFAGTCVDILACSPLRELMQIPKPSTEVIDYIRNSRCTQVGIRSVCCPMSSEATASTTTSIPDAPGKSGPTTCQMTASPPDASSGCCGYEASDGSPKIVGGTATDVNEYPWMALLEYKVENEIMLGCGGVLISGRYVLTAAHCFDVILPVNVRLGEYNTTNSGEDCMPAPGGGEYCTDGAISVPIEKIIKHEDYYFRSYRNDIALIKLARIVEFTDFIRPLCLPTEDFTARSPPNTYLYVAGWGQTEKSFASEVKMKVRVPFMSNQECQKAFSFKLSENIICAGGEPGTDSCKGDSGGPLMRKIGERYEFVGIVSFGLKACGTEGVPAVYAKVYNYLPWIRSHIEA